MEVNVQIPVFLLYTNILCNAFSPNFEPIFLTGFGTGIKWSSPLYKRRQEEVLFEANMHPTNKKRVKIMKKAKKLLANQILGRLGKYKRTFSHDDRLLDLLDSSIDDLPETDSGDDGSTLDCSLCNPVDQECWPIQIPVDHESSLQEFTCLPFTRSMPGQSQGSRNQLNTITSWMDASSVYGTNEQDAAKLRAWIGGRLESQKVHHSEMYMPNNRGFSKCKSSDDRAMPCFRAGDPRNSVTPALASYHTLWVRTHNDIVQRLSKINSHWHDARLFQEARKIVGALHQQISYEEYLPEIIGRSIMDEYGISTRGQSVYNNTCSPDISNVFATAAFRFGHSMIAHTFKVGNKSIKFENSWFNPECLYTKSHVIDQIVKGLTEEKCQKSDRYFDVAVRDRVFGGLDLAAINIQRGRDHALPPYTKFRKYFNLPVPNSFQELHSMVGMGTDVVDAMKTVYKSVDDIDVFTGLLSEPAIADGAVGQLNALILAEQFQRLKNCDRFYYEHKGQAHSFTPDQLASIRQMQFSNLMCNHFDIHEIQAKVFLLADDPGSSGNPLIPCKDYKQIDLKPWRSS